MCMSAGSIIWSSSCPVIGLIISVGPKMACDEQAPLAVPCLPEVYKELCYRKYQSFPGSTFVLSAVLSAFFVI